MSKIIVHSGVFHADDVFTVAYATTRLGIEEVMRARFVNAVPGNFEQGTIVADIGGVYDPDNGFFDHHQETAPLAPDGHKMSAFEQVLRALGSATDKHALMGIAKDISLTDNGIGEYPSGICLYIHSLNPAWDNPDDTSGFFTALKAAKEIISSLIAAQEAKERAEGFVMEAYRNSNNNVVVLQQYAPWNHYLVGTSIKAVVFPSNRGGYMTQIPNVSEDSFDLVGKFDDAIISGWKSCTFVHNNGFCAAFDELQDAIEAANRVISL